MTAVAEKWMTELATLSQEERAEIAHLLIQTLDKGFDDDVEEAWQAELDRRMDDIVSGREVGVDADVAIAKARAMLK